MWCSWPTPCRCRCGKPVTTSRRCWTRVSCPGAIWTCPPISSEIRRLNDDIDDEAMSRKIDRIGEITSKIYGYVKQNPSKEGELRQFLNYYLPTTLKILKAYARMEDQGVEGENIRAAKARIEGMMDKVVEGFEKQLDLLFEVDTMDVTADVEVLERMLEKDGLAGGLEFERPDSIS